MPNGTDWLFSEVFRRLTLVLENTKNHKQREQLQIIIESVGSIKKIVGNLKKETESKIKG